MANASYVKKITVAILGHEPRKLEEMAQGSGAEGVAVARVYGRVNDSKPGTTETGPYIKFEGQFEAVNLVTGIKMRSKNLILPDVGATFVGEGLEAAKKTDPGASLEFGCDITVVENRSSKGGYQFRYGVKPLLGPEGEDALDKLAARLPAVAAITDKSKKK